ncbi:uncharacterized protein LOC131954055 [Physella acuta]|uniref:uncharacterized protein LOC131954055 n=1 Tax=Physella acuta TaxID=109671 RepID=UPI0027DE43CE|nr:uncharacterized protein LOC131954055 [Physella acuta]XP_059173530.1 uncharacterized protein LOC131954055 [Physella acuta]XP_059173531.1 uncharacterized protein LOC131954055 [Physella acuta]XP_059173532.1 uncharacterized protein LOC131954055 [Physella acuta]XP_059173533.1 uncharacterized protein LOC131954055 [Physella acuta]XP_059173534.1 uncharacterized protein LOC131954055 [Physella acuta]XP_059173535.1 uncharacterized protein LOC131954055 [Physella acuta]XP_059173536.1 uncharacterized p
MLKGNKLVYSLTSVIVPSLLLALWLFQLYRCRGILRLRNSYLLETLPETSEWIWDVLSGYQNIVEQQTINNSSYDATALAQHDYHNSALLPGIPSLTVHYLWCVDSHFEISHYISVLSVIHQLRPDKIVIHYRMKPRSDPQGYWRWLEDLQRNVAMLSLRPLKNSRHCSHDLSAGVIKDDFDFVDPYGVFILGDIAVTNLTRLDVIEIVTLSFQETTTSHINGKPSLSEEQLSMSQVFLVADTDPYHVSQGPGRRVITCPATTHINSYKASSVHCLSMNSFINPEFLFKQDTVFHRFSRLMMYGSPSPINIQTSNTAQIPNIVHIILMNGKGDISPLLYASIKSAYVVGKADLVLVHGSVPPSGDLWEKLHSHDELNVHYIPASFEQYSSKHAAMIYGLYALLQYGGIMHFGDVIFISPIPAHVRQYPAIATLHYSQYRLRHRSTNTAILAAAKGSDFVESMLGMLKHGEGTWPDLRADDVATHVGEMKPQSLLLDSKLTAHQNCEGQVCLVAGGHEHPKHSYTTRLIWKGVQPDTLTKLKSVQGPTRGELNSIIDNPHIMPVKNYVSRKRLVHKDGS